MTPPTHRNHLKNKQIIKYATSKTLTSQTLMHKKCVRRLSETKKKDFTTNINKTNIKS